MKLLWEIEDGDVTRVKAFYREHENIEFVVRRRRMNVEGDSPRFARCVLEGDGFVPTDYAAEGRSVQRGVQVQRRTHLPVELQPL